MRHFAEFEATETAVMPAPESGDGGGADFDGAVYAEMHTEKRFAHIGHGVEQGAQRCVGASIFQIHAFEREDGVVGARSRIPARCRTHSRPRN